MVRARAKSLKWKSSSHGKMVIELFEQARHQEALLAARVIAAARAGTSLEQFAADDCLEAISESFHTPLEALALAGDAASVGRLVEAGAVVNLSGRHSVMQIAYHSGSAETIQVLLQKGASLQACPELAYRYSLAVVHEALPGWARVYPRVLEPVGSLEASAVMGWSVVGSGWQQGSVGVLMIYLGSRLVLVPIGPGGAPDKCGELLYDVPLELCTPEVRPVRFAGFLRVLNSGSGVVTEFEMNDVSGASYCYEALNAACDQRRNLMAQAVDQGPVRQIIGSHLATRPALRAAFTLPDFFGMRYRKTHRQGNSSFDVYKQQFEEWCEQAGCRSREPIQLTIERFSLVEQSFEFFRDCEAEQLQQSELLITFEGEAAIDWGGLRKEYWLSLLAALVDPSLGLFVQSASNAGYRVQPAPDAAQRRKLQTTFPSGILHGSNWEAARLRGFWLVGAVLGKALVDAQLVGAHFVAALYKQLMGCELVFADLEAAEPDLHRCNPECQICPRLNCGGFAGLLVGCLRMRTSTMVSATTRSQHQLEKMKLRWCQEDMIYW